MQSWTVPDPNLDEDQCILVLCYEIDLTAPCAMVSDLYGVAEGFEVPTGKRFSAPAQALPRVCHRAAAKSRTGAKVNRWISHGPRSRSSRRC